MAERERGLVARTVSSRGAVVVKMSGGRGWGQHQGDGRGEERQTHRHPLAAVAARAQEQRGGEGGYSAPGSDGT